MAASFTVVGLGEALFDIFPDMQVLGGAPLNVAVHAHQVGQAIGGRGVVVSRIGQDELGRQVLQELCRRGMTRGYVQTDPDRDTGKVYIGLDATGEPEYEIVDGVAWDWLQFDTDLASLAAHCEAVCFGSLAQRNAETRNSIYRFLDASRRAVRLYDVNLRQDFHNQHIIRRSCESANVVKLNLTEFPIVCEQLGQSRDRSDADAWVDGQAEILLRKFNLRMVAVTRGERGTVLYTPGEREETEPVHYPPAENSDHVGAGDACSAGLILGLVKRWPVEKILSLANHMGAFVASQPGATPQLPEAILKMVK